MVTTQSAFPFPAAALPATVTRCTECDAEYLNPAGVTDIDSVRRALDEIAAGPIDAEPMVERALWVAMNHPVALDNALRDLEQARVEYLREIDRATRVVASILRERAQAVAQ